MPAAAAAVPQGLPAREMLGVRELLREGHPKMALLEDRGMRVREALADRAALPGVIREERERPIVWAVAVVVADIQIVEMVAPVELLAVVVGVVELKWG